MLRSPRVLTILVLAATLVFAVGSVVERSGHHEASANSTSAATGHQEGSELGGGEAHKEFSAASEPADASEHAAHSEEHGREATLLGINRESVWLAVAAVMISLGLAATLLVAAGPAALWAAVVWGLGFAAADVAELIEQPAAAVAAIAVLLLALHLTATALAGSLLPGRSTRAAN